MRQMAVEETADGYRIDWQSWVGWSELPWSEIRDLRPVEPKVFRVIASNGDYFNFGFADDRAWRCYKLDAPDGEHLLYGYVERGSELDGKLTPVGGETARSLTLRLRYPKDAPAPDQVIIDSILANGWVVEDSGADQ